MPSQRTGLVGSDAVGYRMRELWIYPRAASRTQAVFSTLQAERVKCFGLASLCRSATEVKARPHLLCLMRHVTIAAILDEYARCKSVPQPPKRLAMGLISWGFGGGSLSREASCGGAASYASCSFPIVPFAYDQDLRSPSGTHTRLVWFEDYLQG